MSEQQKPTLHCLALDLEAGRTSSRTLVSECLDRIGLPGGEGGRAFLKIYAEQALATADFYDRMRRRGAAPGPYAGIPISVKDLFDVAGDTTRAGSIVLGNAAPAKRDALAVARLKAAGFIVLGRTNMTEFAFSGLGINPHYGTPLNPWDRASQRIPGGSSSGAAVSITDAMAFGALGTDTGGSCRIPAAMCGIVGFKPTARRVPLAGTYPLSRSLDSIGPLAGSVACCAALDAVLAEESQAAGWQFDDGSATMPSSNLRLGVLTSYVTDGVVPAVATAFDRTLTRLSARGARLTDLSLTELAELPGINSKGGLSAAESFAHHRAMLAAHLAEYDPRVSSRIARGREQDAADYIDLHDRRAAFIDAVAVRIRQYDAVLMPTIPILPPLLTELAADETYVRINGLVLRNPSIVNFLDGCAISIPIHETGGAPVGLTLFGLRNTDRHLLSVAAVVEGCLR